MDKIFPDDNIGRLNDMIRLSGKIVFFGGAGVSTESGIPDFRSPTGLYASRINPYNVSPEEILSHTYFETHTKEFFNFYREKMIFPEAKPNRAHLKLAELEKAGKNITVVTQNIDGLHQKAGSKNVFELHGSVHRNYCVSCGQFYGVDSVRTATDIPLCSICGSVIKPDVVLYEEGLDADVINGAVDAISNADMIIVAGTSLTVYPAAGFLQYFRGKYAVVMNLTKSVQDKSADLVFHEKVGDIMSQIDTEYCMQEA
jgi:NAD-dependent deacetylase